MPEISLKTRKKLRKTLLSYLSEEGYEPLDQLQLFKACKVQKKYYSTCKELVTELITEKVIEVKQGRLQLPKENQDELMTGKLHVHPKGFGFVLPDDSKLYPQDVFIPKSHMNHAIDTDHVQVRIGKGVKKDKGPEGVIVSIIERARKTLIATIYEAREKHLIAYCPVLGEQKTLHVIPSEKIPLKIGDRVVVQIESASQNILTGSPIEIIGSISDATKDIDAAVAEYSIEKQFPQELIDTTKKLPKNPTKQDLKDRIDLTDQETFTIDPETAKDFDDALSLTKTAEGHYHLIVHIADVSHYVQKDTLLDEEAFRRGNSTYFPNQCIPMLPEPLSNGLCSLKEKVLRLTVSVFMHFNRKGELLDYDIRRTFIKSQKRFSYPEAKEVLDGLKESVHAPTLHLMVELCKHLQKQRYARGSVDLSLPDVSLKIDAKGEPIGFQVTEYDITHQLVEEFMLKANEVIAHSLLSRNIPAIFRVHESPSPSDTEDFASIARAFGFKLKKSPEKEDIQALFEEAKQTPYLHQLSIAFIRSMKLAIYSEQNVGHFGLSLEHYTHFTSPIRRYSDLIVHRLLFESTMPTELLKKMAQHCSERERISFRAEMSVMLLKKLRFLHRYFEEDPNRLYDAVISKVKPFGIYFEVSPLMLEGFIHISEIGDDYYLYLEKTCSLEGQSSHEVFKVGSTIAVRLLHVHLITQQSLWTIERNKPKKEKKKKK